MAKKIYLSLAHMSEAGEELRYIREAFETNWVVPLGPNVDGFEEDLERFLASPQPFPKGKGVLMADPMCYKLLKENSERMRNNPTEAEAILWDALKANATGLHFRRQHIIQDFIVDFYCHDRMLTIELDGGYHDTFEQRERDAYRTSELKRLGYTELRFRNEEVIGNINGVVKQIKYAAANLPSLQGRVEERLLPSLQGRVGERPVVALASGTAAVHLALLACGVGPGDEVIGQSFTFCASANPVVYIGATPVFVDSEPETWNMDPELMEEAIKDRVAKTGRKPKAIMPVTLYGMPYKVDRIMEIAAKYDIPVIEDTAEGLGSRYHGQALGTFGKFGVLSFNGNKMITTSGGGALICPDEEAKRKVMWWATQAREAYPYYQHESIGYNYRMSNVCAGIGRGQMTVVNDHIAHHRHVAQLYKEAFAQVDGIEFHDELPGMESNFWLSTILLDEQLKMKNEEAAYAEAVNGAVGGAAGMVHQTDRVHTDCEPNRNVEALRLALCDKDIESRPLWKPMHKQPVYAAAPAYVNGVSESLFKRGLCLPSGPMVSDEDVERVVSAITENIA